MRDYDPTTGRYLEADPLGLVDGASVYGYVRQNPGRYTDPRGEAVRTLSISDLTRRPPNPESFYCADWEDDCFETWQEDQRACFRKYDGHVIADRAACLERARDIYLNCIRGKPEPKPWTDADEDVPQRSVPTDILLGIVGGIMIILSGPAGILVQ